MDRNRKNISGLNALTYARYLSYYWTDRNRQQAGGDFLINLKLELTATPVATTPNEFKSLISRRRITTDRIEVGGRLAEQEIEPYEQDNRVEDFSWEEKTLKLLDVLSEKNRIIQGYFGEKESLLNQLDVRKKELEKSTKELLKTHALYQDILSKKLIIISAIVTIVAITGWIAIFLVK